MTDPTLLPRLRAIWPRIVAHKGGWPPEPLRTFEVIGGVVRPDCWRCTDGALYEGKGPVPLVPDPTLPGTRAAVLAWLGLPTFNFTRRMTHGNLRTSRSHPREHTPATFVAAVEWWAEEHCG